MGKIRLLTSIDVEAAFLLATQVFVTGSTVHRVLGGSLEEYRAYLRPSFDAAAQQGLSVIAKAATGELLGCMIVVDFVESAQDTAEPHPIFGPVSALTTALSARYARYRTVEAGEVILVDMAAVSPEASGSGVYQKMRDAVGRIARR